MGGACGCELQSSPLHNHHSLTNAAAAAGLYRSLCLQGEEHAGSSKKATGGNEPEAAVKGVAVTAAVGHSKGPG